MAAAAAPARRYLDNAATTWPKPPDVHEAWERGAREVGAAAGRAAYASAVAAGAIRHRARLAMARFINADPSRVALPGGGTLALNLAIHGIVRPGDRVIATAADHNATLRPLHALARRGVIVLDVVPCDGDGRVDPDAVAAAWRPGTRLVVCTHASNVTGAVQDAAAIGAVAHERDGLLVLDAAQTLGQRPLDAGACGADVVCAPAHKWLLAPSGTALLWAREGIELEPLIQGGTGTASESLDMPAAFTECFEPGTGDVAALAGLAAALEWLERAGPDAVGGGCRDLARDCAGRLGDVRGVRVVAVADGAPIVSFTVAGHDPAEVAAVLEQAAGIEVRSGFHCAALIHEHLGTQAGGTIRASFGPFNTIADVDALVATVTVLAGA